MVFHTSAVKMTLYVFRRPYSAIRTLQYVFYNSPEIFGIRDCRSSFLKPATCKAYSAALLCAATGF